MYELPVSYVYAYVADLPRGVRPEEDEIAF
ncbi:MAG: hypothetical protein K0R28_6092, partial [Paenibacillus sp.]|nr:hypothetical protein [Paenibacillus sp.]